MQSDCRGVRYANLWATAHPEKQCMNNLVFYTYYQQLCELIANKPKIMMQVTYMYIKRIKFTADIHRIYIKPCGVKNVDWHNSAYHMESKDINHIIKDWPEEWKRSIVDLSESNEEATKEKDEGKEKLGEKKKKERVGEKNKAPKEDPEPHKRKKSKSHKPPLEGQLGLVNYENIATRVQETLELPMIALVSS